MNSLRPPTPRLFRCVSRWLTLAVLLVLASPWHCLAEAASNPFDAANRLYEERKYPEAAAAYERILASGVASPEVFFNLGNARFKSGEIGRAIAAYRRAAEMTPRDPDVKANLQFARNQVTGPTLRPSLTQRTLGVLSLNEWVTVTAIALWFTFLLLAARQLRPTLQPMLALPTMLCGVAALILALGFAATSQINSPRKLVVVTVRDALVRNGPLEESQTAFPANDGAELRVVDTKDDWLQVTDGTRRIGWLKRSQVARFD